MSDLESTVIIKDDVGVIVRDGTRLSTKVFRPADHREYPVVLALTAYGKDLGPDTYPQVAASANDPASTRAASRSARVSARSTPAATTTHTS